jgi:hypothetical protein
MSKGGAIPVWFSIEDRSRVEEAAALAGYRHLSKYIRDRTLGRREQGVADPMQAWADREELVGRLAALQGGQAATQALLAVLLVLASSKATTRERSELRAACQSAVKAVDILVAATPELASLLLRFVDDA